jgi:hypothetical protein
MIGLIEPAHGFAQYVHDVRLVWACKILLDPFHNVAIYWDSPLALMRSLRY